MSNIVFQNPAFLPLFALVLLPLIIHLLIKTKAHKYLFSSNMLLAQAVKMSVRINKPNNWLVLILRTLFFFFLVALFCKPEIASEETLNASGEKNIVMLLDASASMGYLENGRTRFMSACAEASDIISGLKASDRANVVLVKSSPEAIFPQMGTNFSELKNELRKITVTSEAGNPAEAFNLALNILGDNAGRKICIISDFQKTQWEKFSIKNFASGVGIATIKIGKVKPDNSAITNIYSEPAKPLAGENLRVVCTVNNYSMTPKKYTVFFKSGEMRSSQSVFIPEMANSVVSFPAAYQNPGSYPVEVSIEDDKFPADDRRYTVMDVRESVNVGVIAGDKNEAERFRKALDAIPWCKVRVLDEGELKAEEHFDVLILTAFSSVGKADHYLGFADALIIQPGEAFNIESLSGFIENEKLKSVTEKVVTAGSWQVPLSLRIASGKDRIFNLFTSGEYGNPVAGAFSYRTSLPEKICSPEEILVSYSDGVPALLHFNKNRAVYLWNIYLNRDRSSFAAQALFVPFLGELILDSRSLAEGSSFEVFPGASISKLFPGELNPQELSLTGPDLRSVSIKTEFINGKFKVASAALKDCGIYEWKYGERSLGYAVVNFPAQESDFTVLDGSVFSSTGKVMQNSDQFRKTYEAFELWPYMLLLALVMVFIETLLIMKKKNESSVSN